MMFINYDLHQGVSVNSFRKPEGYTNEDVTGLIEDMTKSKPGNCDLEGSLDAILDGELLATIDADDEAIKIAVENIHSAILEYSKYI